MSRSSTRSINNNNNNNNSSFFLKIKSYEWSFPRRWKEWNDRASLNLHPPVGTRETHRGICPNERGTKGCHLRRSFLFPSTWTALLPGVLSVRQICWQVIQHLEGGSPRWGCVTEAMLHLGISIAKIGLASAAKNLTLFRTKNFNKRIINNLEAFCF